jgi:hypothetical protein
MKVIIAFRLVNPASNDLAADCWTMYSRFTTRSGAAREYQIEADQPDDARVSLVDVISDVTGELHGLVQRYGNSVELVIGVHAVRGD